MSTETEVKLLTLLNVSAIKRPRDMDVPGGQRGSRGSSSPLPPPASAPASGSRVDSSVPAKKRKSVIFGGELGPSGSTYGKNQNKKAKAAATSVNGNGNGNGKGKEKEKEQGMNGHAEEEDDAELDNGSDDEEEETSGASADQFNVHFGTTPDILTEGSIAAVSENQWVTEKTTLKGFGRAVQLRPTESSSSSADIKTRLSPAIAQSLRSSAQSSLVSTSLAHLGSYRDIYLHSLDGEADGSEKTLYGDRKEAMRKAVIVHSLNHVLKTRRKIIRNNEKLARAAADPSAPAIDPPRDQSFTRPKVLLLLPLRSMALHYLTSHLFPLAPEGTQIENLRPFISSFSIPQGAEDPLASTAAQSEYPIDHLVNFRGNSDDNFRFGIKITRKAWRVVMMPANEAKLMECDILIASPLGLKMQSEKEASTDLLSSIEIAVADGMDVMQMQNWEHVQFVFNNLNKIPQSPHGCDFSRVKPWYLDQQAKYLRQTVLMSRYDTPEARSLFHRQCFNLEGKIRLEKTDFAGLLSSVRPGVKQTFERVDLGAEQKKGLSGDAAVDEVEQRFKHFTTQTIPALQRSAISRQNTLIVVPSYFDYVRLVDHMRKDDKISYAGISEYSSNSEISRARTLFFKGKKNFLVVTERFHFYRRYKLRGARTIVFYSLPEHARFYAEFMQTPFLHAQKGTEGEGEVDVEDVSARVLVSRFDALKLERVVGTSDARQILGRGDERFVYA